MQCVSTLHFRMSNSGIAIHYIGWGCQSPNPVLNGNFALDLHIFDLHDIFQEHNPGIK